MVTITSAAVETMRLLLAMCNCMVDSDIGTGYFLLVQGILPVCGHAHVMAYVFGYGLIFYAPKMVKKYVCS